EALGVSRETSERLTRHISLLERWQKRINLVAPASLGEVWTRHVLDSGQLALLTPRLPAPWLDLGSGAGFPGLVLSLMGLGEVHLVESDQRKCTFLNEARRLTEAPATVMKRRIEDLRTPAAAITARALAPLPRLLELAAPITTPETEFWLWKGQDVEGELTEAAKCWKMTVERHRSISDPTGTILHLKEVSRAGTDHRPTD
ncbi:MAG: 16S rRNA (guanine(527)-N(7))-methyltransferase RsmG, partial [Proteobacteria bacterium]|nr:16S rRNA (guanine(527)-N(7))-methyltransferase RsmG [Pseudomonadota bacterium]